MNNNYIENIRIFKALSDENRWKILEILKSGEKCACVLLNELDIQQSTLSHHMKILCDSNIVVGRKSGKWMHYSINEEGLEIVKNCIDMILNKSNSIAYENMNTEGENMSTKTKLYVLTGFLGSGKTTILLKILELLKDKNVGIIQNEFGKLSIDGTILQNDNIQMVEINRGSIFCSCLKLSFVQALVEMSKHKFDYLFVESSGLGDPSNVAEILEAAKAISDDQYDFAGVVCLVDSVNFFNQLGDLETVYRQLKHCHLAVLTKVDLVNASTIIKIKEKIREINPACRIDLSSNGNLNLGFLNEDLMKYKWVEGEETTNSEELKPKTLYMNFEGVIEKEKLELFLREIEPDIYRAKGFFNLSNIGWNQIDLVGKQIDYKSCNKQEKSQLVFISRIGPALIKKIYDAWNKYVGLEMQLKN